MTTVVRDAFYDDQNNEVTYQSFDTPWPKGKTPFCTVVHEGFFMTLMTPESEELKLLSSKQTIEQGVILFASLLGLREAASDI